MAKHQLALAAKATSDTMKVLIFHCSSVNKNINETLSQYSFGTFRGLTITPSGKRNKTHQKRQLRLRAMNIIRILTSQYPEFNSAWDKQDDKKMEMTLQSIESELSSIGESQGIQQTNLMELLLSPSLQKKDRSRDDSRLSSLNTTELSAQKRISIVPSAAMEKLLNIIQMPEESGINGMISGTPTSDHNSIHFSKTDSPLRTNPASTSTNAALRNRSNSFSLPNPLEISLSSQLKMQADAVNTSIIELLATVKHHIKNQDYDEETLIENINSLYRAIIGILLVTKTFCSSEILIHKTLESVVTEISKNASKASEEKVNTKLEVDHCLEQIHSVITRTKSIGLQLMASLHTIPENSSPTSLFSTIFMIIASSKSLTDLVGKIPTLLETFHYLKLKEDEEPEEQLIESNSPKDSNIWSEKSPPTRSDNGQLFGGNLNHLIVEITSSDSHDSKVLKTFITTFRSFASPLQVLEKLVQRFQVPSVVPISPLEKKTIQFRVCVVLQQWIKLQFSDFTESILEKLVEFLDTEVQREHPNFREEIHLRIEKKVNQNNLYIYIFFFRLEKLIIIS